MFLLALLLLHISLSWAIPREHSVLVIPVHDIVRKDLSTYKAHPNFELYTRWLETPQGSYIQQEPRAAFTKYPNIRSIDCDSNIGTCLLTSTVPLSDKTKSRRENNDLIRILEQRSNEEDPAALFERAINKRSGYADTHYASLHLKTYHYLDSDNPVAGLEHYISWNFKCKTLVYSSNGFQVTEKKFHMTSENIVSAEIYATLVGWHDQSKQRSVRILISFACGGFFWGNKCCLDRTSVQNFEDGEEVSVPKTEPTECTKGKDVSNENCESYPSSRCSVNIRQYQKNEGDYHFDVKIYDSNQKVLGDIEGLSVPSGRQKEVGSILPYTLGVTAPYLDDGEIFMTYDGARWGSNDQEHQCKFGAYDGGHRDGSCGFTCVMNTPNEATQEGWVESIPGDGDANSGG